MSIPSPCIGLCRLEEETELCGGCARTGGEIATWSTLSRSARREVWDALPGRRARLGLGLHRLDWSVRDMQSFIVETMQAGGGTWVSGIPGAVAAFRVRPGETVDLRLTGTEVTASTSRAALSLCLSEPVRALAFEASPDTRDDIVVLALSRELVPRVSGRGLTALGPDAGAIGDGGRTEVLYDFGLGRAAGCFGIRTRQGGLIEKLDGCLGLAWPALLAAVGRDLLQASPTRVVRHPLGRIEVFTPIPLPGGGSPPGPHSHLLHAELAAGSDLLPNLPLPRAYVPCAIHYPAGGTPQHGN